MTINFDKFDRFIREQIQLYELKSDDSFFTMIRAILDEPKFLSKYNGPFFTWEEDEFWRSLWDYQRVNRRWRDPEIVRPKVIKVTKKYFPDSLHWAVYAGRLSGNTPLEKLEDLCNPEPHWLREWHKYEAETAVELLAVGLKRMANYRECEMLFDRLSGRFPEYEYYISDEFEAT